MRVNICYGGFDKVQQPKVEVTLPEVKKPVFEVEQKKDWRYKVIPTLAMIPAFLTNPAFASTVKNAEEVAAFSTRIVTMFDPLVQIMQGASYPTALFMLGTGMLLVITGNKTKGLTTMKWASLGFIGMQFLPAIMKTLMEVGQLISAGV